MPRRLSLQQATQLYFDLRLNQSLITQYDPTCSDDEMTGLCAGLTYLNKGTPTYSRRIAAKVVTLYRGGMSSATRYLSVQCCNELSVVRTELWRYAYNALLSYRVIERQIRLEDREIEIVQPALVDIPGNLDVGAVKNRPKRGPGKHKGKNKKAKQTQLFEL